MITYIGDNGGDATAAVFTDSFDRADNTSLTANGGISTWDEADFNNYNEVDWKIISNSLRLNQNWWGTAIAGSSGAADHYAECVVSNLVGNLGDAAVECYGPLVRGNSGNTQGYTAVAFRNVVRLYYGNASGSPITITDTGTLTLTGTHTIRLEAEGASVRVYVDGNLELTQDITSYGNYTTNQYVGVSGNGIVGTTAGRIESFEAGDLATAAGVEVTIADLPVGYTTGDLLLAQIVTREDDPAPAHTMTTGGVSWTQIGTTVFRDFGTVGLCQSFWYRFATSASETMPIAGNSGGATNGLKCIISTFRGVDNITILDGVTVQSGHTGTSSTWQVPPSAGTIIPFTNNAWIIAAVSTSDLNTLSVTTANGFTERYSFNASTGANTSHGLATSQVGVPGATSGPTWTQTTAGPDAWAWHCFVLKPAPPVLTLESIQTGGTIEPSLYIPGIAQVGISTQAASATSPVTVTLPAYQAGDLLIAQITTRATTSATHSITTSGTVWTQIGSNAFSANGISQSVWYRWATKQGEVSPSATCTGTPGGVYVTITSWRGVDLATPLDGVTIQQGVAGPQDQLTPQSSNITPNTSGAFAIAIASTNDDNALAVVTAQGFATTYSGASYDSTIGSNASQIMAHKSISAAQTAPTFDITVNGTDTWAWHYLVLRPKPTLVDTSKYIDDFNRADSTTITGGSVTWDETAFNNYDEIAWKIVSNTLRFDRDVWGNVIAGNCGSSDHYSEVVVSNLATTTEVYGPLVRGNSTNQQGYILVAETGLVRLYYGNSSGTPTSMDTSRALSLTGTHTIRLEAYNDWLLGYVDDVCEICFNIYRAGAANRYFTNQYLGAGGNGATPSPVARIDSFEGGLIGQYIYPNTVTVGEAPIQAPSFTEATYVYPATITAGESAVQNPTITGTTSIILETILPGSAGSPAQPQFIAGISGRFDSTLNVPTGTQTGDLMIFFASDSAPFDGGPPTFTAPTGATEIAYDAGEEWAPAVKVWKKISTGEASFSAFGGAQGRVGIATIRNSDGSNLAISSIVNNLNTASMAWPTVSTVEDAIVLAMVGILDTADVLSAWPSGYADAWGTQTGYYYARGGYKVITTTGNEIPGAATYTGGGGTQYATQVTVAVEPNSVLEDVPEPTLVYNYDQSFALETISSGTTFEPTLSTLNILTLILETIQAGSVQNPILDIGATLTIGLETVLSGSTSDPVLEIEATISIALGVILGNTTAEPNLVVDSDLTTSLETVIAGLTFEPSLVVENSSIVSLETIQSGTVAEPALARGSTLAINLEFLTAGNTFEPIVRGITLISLETLPAGTTFDPSLSRQENLTLVTEVILAGILYNPTLVLGSILTLLLESIVGGETVTPNPVVGNTILLDIDFIGSGIINEPGLVVAGANNLTLENLSAGSTFEPVVALESTSTISLETVQGGPVAEPILATGSALVLGLESVNSGTTFELTLLVQNNLLILVEALAVGVTFEPTLVLGTALNITLEFISSGPTLEPALSIESALTLTLEAVVAGAVIDPSLVVDSDLTIALETLSAGVIFEPVLDAGDTLLISLETIFAGVVFEPDLVIESGLILVLEIITSGIIFEPIPTVTSVLTLVLEIISGIISEPAPTNQDNKLIVLETLSAGVIFEPVLDTGDTLLISLETLIGTIFEPIGYVYGDNLPLVLKIIIGNIYEPKGQLIRTTGGEIIPGNVGDMTFGAFSPMDGSLPIGYIAGDLFIAQITSREDDPTPVHGITTGGVSWTQIGTTQFYDIGGTGITESIWYRFAQSNSEAVPSVTCPSPLTLAVTISSYQGVDLVTPLGGITIQEGVNAGATTLQTQTSSIMPNTVNDYALAFASTSDLNTLDLETDLGFDLQYSNMTI